MKEKAFVSVLIYAYNSKDIIEDSLLKIDSTFSEIFESYEIILINDGSSDQTYEKAKETCKKLTGVSTILNLAWKHNVETAMQAGIDYSIGDFVYEIDSPIINYSTDIFHELFKKATEGYDMVSAVPKSGEKVSSKIFYRLYKKMSSMEIILKTENMRIITRRAINAISDIKDKIRYRKILYKYSGFPSTYFYYEEIEKKTRPLIPFRDRINLAIDILFSFSNIGLKLNVYLSMLFLLISLGLGIYTIAAYLTLEKVVTGWTTTMMFLSFGFSGLFLVLAFLNKYISLVLTEIKTIPSYTIRNIEKI